MPPPPPRTRDSGQRDLGKRLAFEEETDSLDEIRGQDSLDEDDDASAAKKWGKRVILLLVVEHLRKNSVFVVFVL